jgi:hypothetical protein
MLRKSSLADLTSRKQSFLKANAAHVDSVGFVLVVNKAEMGNQSKQEVFPEDVTAWCAENGVAHVFETSAALDTNIASTLVAVAELAATMERQRRGILVDPVANPVPPWPTGPPQTGSGEAVSEERTALPPTQQPAQEGPPLPTEGAAVPQDRAPDGLSLRQSESEGSPEPEAGAGWTDWDLVAVAQKTQFEVEDCHQFYKCKAHGAHYSIHPQKTETQK